MAFVAQSKRTLNNTNSNLPDNLGPGVYLGHSEYKIQRSAAPFNTVIQRDSNQKEKLQTPGPGQYNYEQTMENGQKVVLMTGGSSVKILEVPKPQSNFKSSSKRFNESKNKELPGPGAYNYEQQQIYRKHQRQNQNNQPNIVEHLMKINRYQSIPSIPVKNQIYGYTEKDNNDLELNKNPEVIYTGIKQDIVGPGQYELKDTFTINQNKGSSWYKSKVSRSNASVSKEKLQSVGPGTYDHLNKHIPLYKLRPSVGFQSKSQRGFDQRRGQYAQQFIMQRLQSNQQKYKGMNDNIQQQDLDDSEQIEFIDDTTPGPGHYNPQHHSLSTSASAQSQIRQQKKDPDHAFGSQCQRFKQDILSKSQQAIGPGNYNLETNIAKNEPNNNHPPFQSSNTRFEQKQIGLSPGPQQYNPKLTLLDKLIEKNQHGPLGNFGTNQQRFAISKLKEDPPGPGQYEYDVRPHTQEVAPNGIFKSKTKRDPFTLEQKRDIIPPPGAYQIENFTIEKKTRVEQEEDKDLAIKKPPFNSSVMRFVDDKVKQDQDDDEDDLIQSNQKNINELFRRAPEKTAAFNVKQTRFNYEPPKEQLPGPGQYYDPQNNDWNKRTYNILFAEI